MRRNVISAQRQAEPDYEEDLITINGYDGSTIATTSTRSYCDDNTDMYTGSGNHLYNNFSNNYEDDSTSRSSVGNKARINNNGATTKTVDNNYNALQRDQQNDQMYFQVCRSHLCIVIRR